MGQVTICPAGKRLLRVRVGNWKVTIKDCRGWRSLRGLMFDSCSEGALISGNSVWMPFVKHPLTLYFLDKEFNLLDRQEAVPLTWNPKTWKVYSCPGARYVLEIAVTTYR